MRYLLLMYSCDGRSSEIVTDLENKVMKYKFNFEQLNEV